MGVEIFQMPILNWIELNWIYLFLLIQTLQQMYLFLLIQTLQQIFARGSNFFSVLYFLTVAMYDRIPPLIFLSWEDFFFSGGSIKYAQLPAHSKKLFG